ncbi:MAG TPA: enoyl-CoA hydratase/isomerase family protein [Dehalococcoidia bacterium]|nr:enoyl-CoA hydratase/isomerase family protein [Dehalococcoidia bacterium]
MQHQDLKVEEREDGVWVVTLSRPERLNAMRARTVYELLPVLERGAVQDACKVLVITGEGRGFCSGADLLGGDTPDEVAKMAEASGYRRSKEGAIGHWGVLFTALNHFPKPVIAAVNGVAAGAGLSLALSADIRIASTEARFISVFVRRGLTPDTGTTFHLPRLIGDSRALEMMFTGDAVDAATAERWGLVNRVVEPSELMPAALDLAGRIAAGPSITIELTKRLVRDLTHEGVDRQLQNEAWAIGVQTEDKAEGGRAFRERREPRWTGR